MRPFVLAALPLLLCGQLSAFEPAQPFHVPNAVLLNISEADLNRIARDAFRDSFGSNVEGETSDPSRGVQELRYAASFSEPVLALDAEGGMRVDLSLLQAEMRIGRLERKFLRRMASCDGAGVNVDPERPIELAVQMRFEIDEHDLHIVPQSVSVEDPKSFRLVKPTTCRNTGLPKWLVWWIGKSQLRRKLNRIDELLLDKAREGAAELNEDGLLTKRWSIQSRDDPARASALYLYPQKVETGYGSLLVGFAGSTTEPQAATHSMPDWVAAESERSYVGLSESFLNVAVRAAVGRLRTQPRQPSKGVSKMLRGSAARSLIPGLRELESTDELRLGLAFHDPPKIEFEAIEAATPDEVGNAEPNRALIRIRLSGAVMTIWDADEVLGALEIESARLAVAPYLNLLGGISFDVVENAWSLSSRGIEFDEETLAATFQELFFGEMFETRYEPVAQRSFELGETEFQPRYFSLLGQYLVIGLSD